MKITDQIRTWARRIKRDAVTLWFACRDARTPLAVQALCAFVVAYALSPIDLIPDFIPVLGYLDDALLLPALIWPCGCCHRPLLSTAAPRPMPGWPPKATNRSAGRVPS